MTITQFNTLKEGDIVRSKQSHTAYIVTGTYEGRVTAVRSVDLTNPNEWDLVSTVKERTLTGL